MIETFSARPVLEKDPEGISVDPSPGDDRLRIAKSGTPEPHDSTGLDNYLIKTNKSSISTLPMNDV
jgi:hypothetical protein